MSSQETPEGEKLEVIDFVFELPPSPRGTYQRKRKDGAVVHGDASGEWTLNEEGEIDDIVFVASPLWLRKARKT